VSDKVQPKLSVAKTQYSADAVTCMEGEVLPVLQKYEENPAGAMSVALPVLQMAISGPKFKEGEG
jgi:hypothetical protein